METLKLDISKTGVAVSAAMQAKAQAANALLESGKGAGSDFLGWVHLPSSITPDRIEAIEKQAAKLREKAEVIICIGIGGSYLGAKAVLEAMSDSFKFLHKKRAEPVVVFAGQNISEDYTRELLEAVKEYSIATIVISKSGTTTEPAIAFRLIKAEIEKRYGKQEAAERIVAITDKARGALKTLATQEGYPTFVIPDDGSVYTVTPRISKPLGRDLKLTVYVDEKALDEYNKQNNTSYTLLPNTNYEFESSAVIPAGKVVSNPVTITLHPLPTEQNKTGFVHALPIAVKAEGEAMQVLEGADAFVLAATPVPYSNVVEITGNSYLQTRFAEDYKLSSWTFETLFNPSQIYTGNTTTWLASAIGYYEQGGTKIIQDGFMLRLGDSGGGTKNSLINGMVSRSGKQISSIPLQSNIWHHIAIVCDEGDITLYVNGNVGYTAKSGYAATQFYALNGIRFGNESASGNLGSLRYRYCQVRFWSVARSVEELNNNRYAVPADTPGLLGYWKLNEYTEGKAMVPGPSVKGIEEDTPMTETETYLFKDATGKQPDALIHRASANTPYIFTPDKRIEVGYTWDGVLAQ